MKMIFSTHRPNGSRCRLMARPNRGTAPITERPRTEPGASLGIMG
jgi:hypothetical protein